ncbi:PA2779 family protein [Shumkonia mesophila]|uniref:PA2779 family protein n=1 Tax=Shumkonia mesophila TaxID=2838854 RepID=UPI0029346C6D|nr:PA2779 family protein [Shumkonia mesophila]
MSILRRLRHFIVAPLIAAMTFLSMPLGVAQAGLVGSEAIVAAETNAANRQAVDAFLQRQDVRDQLQTMGVDPAEAGKRVAALSDAEVAKIAGTLPADPAGEGALGILVGAVIIVAVVLLITDVLGLTSVYPFTRPIR